MDSVLKSAARRFVSQDHIRNVLEGELVDLVDESDQPLPGIQGRAGVAAPAMDGPEIGADLIEMQPGSAFPLHTHPGEHILYIVRGTGIVHVDGVDHRVSVGDTIFVPAEYPHGVKTLPDASEPFLLLAVGYPHKHIDATDRMKVIQQTD